MNELLMILQIIAFVALIAGVPIALVTLGSIETELKKTRADLETRLYNIENRIFEAARVQEDMAENTGRICTNTHRSQRVLRQMRAFWKIPNDKNTPK